MKKLILSFLIVTSLLFVSCTGGYNNGYGYNGQYDMMYGPNNQQMVVVHDGGSSYLMDYLLFSSLMRNGGYGNVIHHYHSYPSSVRVYNSSSYGGWRRSSYNYNASSPVSGYRSNSPSTGSGFRTVTPSSGFRSSSPSNSIYSRPSSSSSSGFRSSSSGFRSSSSSGFRSSSRRR